MKKNQYTQISKNVLLTSDSPFAYTEAYKSLRTNMNFVTMNGKYKKIVVTSSIPDEGKSSISINLATTLAQKGAKVILIDCDMRSPSIHKYLSIKQKFDKGLSNLLAGAVSIEDCMIQDPASNFAVIPSGEIPPNPSELLESPNMKRLLDVLTERFDYVICDTPPATVVTDSAIVSRYCDGVLLVIRQKFATREQVRKAKQNLDAVGANIIGAILDRYDAREDANSGYRKGYGKYEYKYGYSYGPDTQNSTVTAEKKRSCRLLL